MKSGFSVSHFSVHLSGLHWLIPALLFLSTGPLVRAVSYENARRCLLREGSQP